jgi:hypothetical protein
MLIGPNVPHHTLWTMMLFIFLSVGAEWVHQDPMTRQVDAIFQKNAQTRVLKLILKAGTIEHQRCIPKCIVPSFGLQFSIKYWCGYE